MLRNRLWRGMNRLRMAVIAVTAMLSFTVAASVLGGLFIMSGHGPSLSVNTAHANEDPSAYDTDCDGQISRDEVLEAISVYFQGGITRDLVLEIISLYFSQAPVVHPTPPQTPDPSATPDPTATLSSCVSPTPPPTLTPTPEPTPAVLTMIELVKKVRPSVVRITQSTPEGVGTGTGLIFETEGQTAYIITNGHVVDGTGVINVNVNDSTDYTGTLLGVDARRDLAVLTICCGSFTPTGFGDAESVEVGADVVAVGYAKALRGQATATRGTVSAKRYDAKNDRDLIQTDAPINPGNSGGPLLSFDGLVIGINTFGLVDTEGLNFAVSETTVQQHIPTLKAGGPAPTPAPTLTPQPTPDPVESDFGPISGSLQHDPSSGFIKGEYVGVSMADITVEATFYNPYSASSNSWDYGFVFRRDRFDRTSSYLQLVISSDSAWRLIHRTPDGNDVYETVGGGTVSGLNTGTGESNRLRVIAIEAVGYLFVNGAFVTSLELGDVARAGDIAVITGAYAGDEVAGAATRFENFRGDQLHRRYGPATGTLEKEPGFVAEHDSHVRTRDLVTWAEFVSPQTDDWSFGFVIRNPQSNRLEVIGVSDEGRWFHETRDVGDSEYTTVADGYVRDLGARLDATNGLLVIAMGAEGWVFLNSVQIAQLDLSHNLDVGWSSATANFFSNDSGDTEFSDYHVWAP